MPSNPAPYPLPDSARCLQCDYLLRGLTEPRCPECGREFDPADPKTYATGPRIGWLSRRMLAPIGWPFFVLAIAAVSLLLWTSGVPVPGRDGVHASLIDVRSN